MTFEYMLLGAFDPAADLIPGVQVYLIDGFGTTAAAVADLKSRGLFPVCYFSAGSYENWRPDAPNFTAADKGLPLEGWEGELWLNVQSANVKAIMLKRMTMCAQKGFLGVDPDNVDGYANDNGVVPPLTADDQLALNTWLADTAHSLGLAVGLKNDMDQVADLEALFDFFVNEQCQQYDECDVYTPAKLSGKPVWSIEYNCSAFGAACNCQQAYGITSIFKHLNLSTGFREECPDVQNPQCSSDSPPANVTCAPASATPQPGGRGGAGAAHALSTLWLVALAGLSMLMVAA